MFVSTRYILIKLTNLGGLVVKDLGLDYLDMYLVHWPVSQPPPDSGTMMAGDLAAEDIPLWETFEAMKLLKDEGLTRGVGVSNFNIAQIQDIIDDCDSIPDVNQVEVRSPPKPF